MHFSGISFALRGHPFSIRKINRSDVITIQMIVVEKFVWLVLNWLIINLLATYKQNNE